MTASLPDAEWLARPGIAALLDALDARLGMVRVVGGAVRDGLLGLPVSDVDMATRLTPQQVVDRLEAAGIKAVPTGMEHGTVTAVSSGSVVEVTTLRRDVSTDGRRATVAFTDDWREDAARRDFTINALYADPITRKISDYFGGVADLEARRVRFIGDPSARIAEDHLRILRYFRFLARFGRDNPDPAAYAACRAAANSLMALSRERIADELLKLLSLPDPAPVVRLMIEGDILRPVLPEMADVERLTGLITAEQIAGVPAAAIRRLAALLPSDPKGAALVAARLKLSKKLRARLVTAATSDTSDDPHALAYAIGPEGAVDRLLLDPGGPRTELAALAAWRPPSLPIGGGALIARGLSPGPDVASALRAVEDQWIAEGFPDADRVAVIADQTVSKFQRARQ